jgi:hypothetical protein
MAAGFFGCRNQPDWLPCVAFVVAVSDQHLGTTMNAEANFTALADETRSAINTNEAAFHLGRTPQTLRKWACYEDGPLRPIRIHGRLAWPVAQIKQLLQGGSV